MSYSYCTIITQSHLAWAFSLFTSLEEHSPGTPLVVLVVDGNAKTMQSVQAPVGVSILYLDDIRDKGVGESIMTKYAHQPDELRWSLKPVLMLHLLERYEKVAYCDCDLFFFSDHRFLMEELDLHAVLLTPHWRCSNPAVDLGNYNLLLREGLYNAGFIAAHRAGRKALQWWANSCYTVCVKDSTSGQYVDQAHLNLLPIYFDRVHVIKHRGCNVANWNRIECLRTPQPDGTVLINGTFPIVFIHFTQSMISGVLKGQDPHLLPYLQKFNSTLLRFDPSLDVIARTSDKLETERKEQEKRIRKEQRSFPNLVRRVKRRVVRIFDRLA